MGESRHAAAYAGVGARGGGECAGVHRRLCGRKKGGVHASAYIAQSGWAGVMGAVRRATVRLMAQCDCWAQCDGWATHRADVVGVEVLLQRRIGAAIVDAHLRGEGEGEGEDEGEGVGEGEGVVWG